MENKHEVAKVSGAKQLPYAVKAPFFWFVFFGAAKKMKRWFL